MVAYPGEFCNVKQRILRANNGMVHSNAYTLVTELPSLFL